MKRKLTKKSKRVKTLGYHLLSLPAVFLSVIVVFVPAIQTIYTAFTQWNGISPHKEFIGLANFKELATDWIFWQAVTNNVKWTLLFISIPVLIAMLSAVLIAHFRIGHKTFQAIYLVPYLLAPTTNAIIWLNIIFSPTGGLVGFLQRLGMNITSPLGDMKTALYGVAAVDIWHYWGFLTVIYLAALRQTPTEQIEAAQIESANGFQIYFYIYLPNIAPTIRLMFTFIVIYSFMTFDYIYLLTSGGPAHATEMLSTYAYTMAFSAFKFGKAAAISLAMGFLGSFAAFFYSWFSRKETLA